MTLIKCDNVSLGYEGRTILKDLNFSLNGGEYLCIVGENGAGKSTLIKTILGLKKPMKGMIETGDNLKRTEIGYMPQQTDAQKDFPASVYEVVISGRLNSLGMKPFFGRRDKADVMDKLRLMGIANLKNKCFHDLSGGQKQRVLLARAMCATKRLILLDEPVAGLDPVATQELYDLIEQINRQMGITVIMVSHDTEATLKYASHILHLSHDKIFFGTKDEFMHSEDGIRFAQRKEV